MKQTQKCIKCGEVKELAKENFYSDGKGGFKTKCKSCTKKYYEENKEKKQRYQREYARENKEYYREYQRAYSSNGRSSIRKKDIIQEVKQFTNDIIKVDGKIHTKDGREYTRLVGGFGEGKTIVTTKQIAELMNTDNRTINQTINRNIDSFQIGVDIEDLKKKSDITQCDSESFSLIGYSQNAYNGAKNIYVLSESGLLLYLKFAEGERAVELYKDFIENYFKTKVELKIAEKTIEENSNLLEDTKMMLIGKIAMTSKETDKIELLCQLEKVNKQIEENKIILAKEETIQQFQELITISEKFTNSKGCYDIGLFSKMLGIKNLGRNNMFKWMRENKILMEDNTPYQSQMDHFKVVNVNKGNMMTNKTVLKANGIKYLVGKLIKDGYIKNKTYNDVINLLDELKEENIA